MYISIGGRGCCLALELEKTNIYGSMGLGISNYVNSTQITQCQNALYA